MPGFGRADLARLFDQPGVHLNAAEEQALEREWRVHLARQCGRCGGRARESYEIPEIPRRAGCGCGG